MEKEWKKKIDVSMISFKSGIVHYDDVKAIRVHDQKYRLLLMSDHTPILGEVKGTICLLTDHDEKVFENVHGFFSLVNNQFKFVER